MTVVQTRRSRLDRRQRCPSGKDVGGRARTCRGDYLACCPAPQFTRDQRDDDDHE
jgi:hypothetical protein